MGGSSTPQNANAGNALTNLFLSNQATPHIATPPLVAPQSMLGQGGGQMPPMGSSMSPVAYQPEQKITQPSDAYSFGFGGGDIDNTPHPFAHGNFGAAGLGPGAYVQQTKTIPAQITSGPSNASILAAMMNKQNARK